MGSPEAVIVLFIALLVVVLGHRAEFVLFLARTAISVWNQASEEPIALPEIEAQERDEHDS